MHGLGRKEAGFARLHLEFLADFSLMDFHVRLALEQVADLLDARMRVRQRALAALQFADQDLDLLRAHGLRPDQAVVARPDVVCR